MYGNCILALQELTPTSLLKMHNSTIFNEELSLKFDLPIHVDMSITYDTVLPFREDFS